MNDFNSFYEYFKKVKISENSSRCCIYIVECNGVYKIGTTSNIKSRLSTLQTSSPFSLNLIYTIPIPFLYKEGEVEKALHIIFENVYIRGEWYKLTEQDIERIKIISIDDILYIAQKMKAIKEKNSNSQMTFNFIDNEDH